MLLSKLKLAFARPGRHGPGHRRSSPSSAFRQIQVNHLSRADGQGRVIDELLDERSCHPVALADPPAILSASRRKTIMGLARPTGWQGAVPCLFKNRSILVRVPVLRIAVLLALATYAGCGALRPSSPENPRRLTIRVWSSAFTDDGMIPSRFTCDGSDRSPALAWSGVPEKSRTLALICDDPDAPVRHLVALGRIQSARSAHRTQGGSSRHRGRT